MIHNIIMTRSFGNCRRGTFRIHISLKKSCTDFFQSFYACWSTRDPKQHPKSQEKCCFHNVSPLSHALQSTPSVMFPGAA